MTENGARLSGALAGRYTIEREIGQGGMATVYLAEDLKHHRRVAVKVLRPELAQALGPDRFLREIEIAARLNHPNILTLIDSGEAEGFLYFVMPFVEDDTLRSKVQREGPLPVPDVIRLAREIVDALAHAHRQGVVHRDVKPDNVMLTEGHAVVTDFGVAKALSAATGRHEITTVGVTLGTPTYMAPEQAAAEPTVDHRADLYAVGVMIYEMLVGEPPFVGTSAQEVLAAHIVQEPRHIAERRAGLPPALADLVMRCLAKKREDRWQSAEDLRAALDGVITPGEGTAAARRVRPAPLLTGWRLWAAVAAVAAVAVAGLVLRPWRAGLGAGSVGASEDVVAVLPFTVRGSDELAYLGEGMVSLLSRKLDGAGELRSVDSRALLGYIERQGATVDPATGRGIADRFGAGLYVIGDILEAGGQLQLSAALYGTGRGAAPIGEGTAEGPAEDVFGLVDRVAADLLGSLEGPGTRVRQLASVTTSSLPALKAYLECESLYRQGLYQPATDACERAIAEDTSYALAYYRLSITAELGTLSHVAQQAAEAAYERSGRLAERDQRMVEALLAWRLGRHAEAERLYRSLVGEYPDDIEALQHLGEVLFHGGPLHGKPFTDAREPFERVLELEPNHSIAVVHLARIASAQGRLTQLDSLVATYVQLNPEGDRELEMLALLAFARNDSARQEDLLRRLERASDVTLGLAVWDVVVWTDNLTGAERSGRILASSSRSPAVQAAALGWLAHMSLARGRWTEARSHVRRMESVDPAIALEYRALLWSLPFVQAPRDTLRALRGALTALDPDTIPPSTHPSVFFRVEPWGHRMVRDYLLGLVSVRLGDATRAEQGARALEALGLPLEAGTFASDLAAGIRAQLALARGDTARAMDLLEAAERHVWYLATFSSPVHAQVLERFTLADALLGTGRAEEAHDYYEHITGAIPYEVAYRPWTHLRRAEIAERRSDRATARSHYERFLEFWEDADAELRHWADTARIRLANLEG